MTSSVFFTATLLTLSNVFMTFAWYGHLKFTASPLWIAVLASWGIAFFEYCLQVPANRMGYGSLDGYQLKILQECITIAVFIAFATFYLREPIQMRYLVSFGLILSAVAVAFYK